MNKNSCVLFILLLKAPYELLSSRKSEKMNMEDEWVRIWEDG
jgi:hypothetical protein